MREQRRLQRRKRRTIVVGLFLIIIIIAVVSFIRPNSIEASEPIKVVAVQIEAGDSLWKLADRYDNNTMDLRKYIYIIERFNNLDGKVLLPGQTILIPVYESTKGTIALTSPHIK